MFVALVGLFVKNPSKFGVVNPTPKPFQKEIKISDKTVDVELADTPEKRMLGLSGRTSLEENSGMLFTFDQNDTYPSFWMKGMLMSIDIIWINDNKITKIEKSIPFPVTGTRDQELKLYRPDKPIDFVLEVNAGFSEKNGVKVGQSLSGL